MTNRCANRVRIGVHAQLMWPDVWRRNKRIREKCFDPDATSGKIASYGGVHGAMSRSEPKRAWLDTSRFRPHERSSA
jgi:hypothetical protein